MQDKPTQEPVAWRDGETGFVGRLKGGQHWQPLYQTLPYDHNTDAAARIAELEKQRDTLLAACEEALEAGSDGDWQSARRALTSAIASVKGGAAHCTHCKAKTQYTGDGTPIEYCPDCGRNEVAGSAPDEMPSDEGDTDGGSRAGYECPVCRQSDCRGCKKGSAV